MAIDAEHPRFVPMTNGRVRWQADRRLAGRFNVALLQPSGTAVIGSFHLPAPQPRRQRRIGRAIACARASPCPVGSLHAERLHQRLLAADTLAVLEAFSDRFRHGERPDAEWSIHG